MLFLKVIYLLNKLDELRDIVSLFSPGVPAVAHIREALGRNDPYRVSYRRMY